MQQKSPRRGISAYCLDIRSKDIANDEVNDSKSEDYDDEANDTIENGIFGFLNFASVARGSHIADATDDNNYYGNNAKDAYNRINDADDGVFEVATGTNCLWEFVGAICK